MTRLSAVPDTRITVHSVRGMKKQRGRQATLLGACVGLVLWAGGIAALVVMGALGHVSMPDGAVYGIAATAGSVMLGFTVGLIHYTATTWHLPHEDE